MATRATKGQGASHNKSLSVICGRASLIPVPIIAMAYIGRETTDAIHAIPINTNAPILLFLLLAFMPNSGLRRSRQNRRSAWFSGVSWPHLTHFWPDLSKVFLTSAHAIPGKARSASPQLTVPSPQPTVSSPRSTVRGQKGADFGIFRLIPSFCGISGGFACREVVFRHRFTSDRHRFASDRHRSTSD